MNNPIRVLHVIGIMNRGGAEAMIMNLYRKIDKTKVQFDFVENSFESAVYDEEIQSLGGKIFRCPRFSGNNYFEYKQWWKSFFDEHKGEFAAVHGHIGSSASIYLYEAKKHGIYTIAHCHSTQNHQTVKYYIFKAVSYPLRFFIDRFFGCSTEAGLSRYGKKVVESNKYENFNNAIDSEKFIFNEETRKAVRNEFQIKDNELLIGTIGRLTKAKNPEFIFKIFQAAIKKSPNTKCIWVGTGEYEEEINQWIADNDLQNKIIMTGVRSDINRLLQGIDCFVFPSLYEGLPVTVIEAQTAGVHCLLSDTISKEVEITNLIEWFSLNKSAEEWADKCFEFAEQAHTEKRISPIDSICNNGYDIHATVEYLTNFYLEHSK